MENVSIKQLFIFIGVLWTVITFLYFFVFSKKSKPSSKKESNNNYQPQDIIQYPQPFIINVVIEKDQSLSPVIVCDLLIKYSDLVSNNYVVPESLNNSANTAESTTEEENKIDASGEEEEIEFTNSDDENAIPDFENYSDPTQEEEIEPEKEEYFEDLFSSTEKQSPVTENGETENNITVDSENILPTTDIHKFDDLNSEF
jgi:hypothetical protein